MTMAERKTTLAYRNVGILYFFWLDYNRQDKEYRHLLENHNCVNKVRQHMWQMQLKSTK